MASSTTSPPRRGGGGGLPVFDDDDEEAGGVVAAAVVEEREILLHGGTHSPMLLQTSSISNNNGVLMSTGGGLVQKLAQNRFAVLLTLLAGAGSLQFGFHIGFSSPAGRAIKDEAQLTDSQLDFVLSVINIGCMIGGLVSGALANKIGRKIAVALVCVPFILGSLTMIQTPPDYLTLVSGRVLIGIGGGMSAVLVPLYITEIAPSSLRGLFGCVNQLCITIGILIANWSGSGMHWLGMLRMSLPPAIATVVFLWIYAVETPSFLVSQKRDRQALDVLKLLRGPKWDVNTELAELSRSASSARVSEHDKDKKTSLWADHSFRRALLIGALSNIFQQWSGIDAVMFNTAGLFMTVSEGSVPTDEDFAKALNGAVMIAVVQVLITLGASSVVENFGRKSMLSISYVGMAACSIGVAVAGGSSINFKIFLFISYIIFFGIGCGPMTSILTGEILPVRSRDTGIAVCVLINRISSFLVTSSFSSLSKLFGANGVFAVYGFICIFAALYFQRIVETKGKSFEEIEMSLK